MHPKLRPDLELHESAPDFHGAPQWVIHDPLRNLFFSVDWITFEFISRWDETPEEIIQAINQDTTLEVSQDDYESILKFLVTNELLELNGNQALDFLNKQAKAKKSDFWHWALHNYLFFRIPLIQIDRFLERHQKKVDFLYSGFFLKLTLLIGVVGLLRLFNQFDVFVATFLDLFSWQGFLAYFVALTGIKIIHEFAHAFTAKRLGCKVPTMGVAFLIMAPFAYTDTNDIWKLKDRKSRLLVDVAGVVSELIVAAWAIFLWGLLEPGLVKNIFYILGTITWINTLTVNLSPFMRFDGYYALSDYLRVSNLHARAAALTKWHFRKHVFGFKDEIPEVFPKPLEQTLILFSWATTLYRITVFLSIAYLIYHFFIKIVGIILFAIEIIWFVFLPIYLEIAVWMKRREEIRKGPLRHRSFNLLILVLFLVIFPWHFEVKEMGILKPTDRLYIYAPEASQIASPLPTNGDTIKSGQDMVHLSSIDLEKDMLVAEKEREIAEWKVTASAFNPDLKNNLQSNALNEKAILNNIEMLKSAKKELNTRAPFDGTYYELSPDLDQGDWLGKGAKLGVLVNPKKWSAEAYFPEEVMHRINVGQYAKFFPETAGNEVMTLKINSIDPSPTKIITDQIFTSQMGGSVVAKITGNKATTDRPYYKVTFLTTEAPKKINPIQRGHIVVYAKPESVLSSLIRNALVIYHRELSF